MYQQFIIHKYYLSYYLTLMLGQALIVLGRFQPVQNPSNVMDKHRLSEVNWYIWGKLGQSLAD